MSVNLVVGLRYGRNVKTIKDYALGGRNFSTAALVSTIVATWVSGSGFFITLANTYSDGLYYLIASCGMSLSLIVTACFLVPRMKEFLGNTSVAEAMGQLYGKEIRLITAICGILGNVGGIAVQFKVFGNVFYYFLGIDGTYAILIASFIVIAYSAFGGIRAVTYTDIVQFITFGVVVPIIGIIVWNNIFDSGFSLNTVTLDPKFNLMEVINFGNPKFWEMLPLLLYFAIPTIDAMDFQRISMGRNIFQVKKALLVSAGFLILIKLGTAWIPFLVQSVNPSLEPNEIIVYIVKIYTYTGLKGLVMIGIASMAMSTADSRINSASVLFGNDIAKIFDIKINELLVSKMFSLLLGGFGIYLALSKTDLLNIVMTSASLYMPIITIPFLAAILGFRSSKISVLIGMAAGFITIIIGNIYAINADIIIWGMAMNLIFLLISHYLLRQPGGFVGIKDPTDLSEIRAERKRKIEKLLVSIKEFSFIAFCKRTAPKNELMYMGFGIYCILYSVTTMYSTQIESLKENGNIILIMYQIMMVTGVVLAMYPIWPKRIKKEIIVQISWNFVIFYMLIFFSNFFVMVSDFGRLQFATFTINILITAVLVGWKLSLTMMILGFYLSTQFYKYYAGMDSIDISVGSSQFIFMYTLMLIGSALVIFLKPKQEYQELTEEKYDHLSSIIGTKEKEAQQALALKAEFIRNVNHEYHAPMTGVISLAEILVESYHKLNDQQRLEAAEVILKSSRSLKAFDDNITTLAYLSKPHYVLKKEDLNFSDLMYDRVETCRRLYEENKKGREFILDIEEGLMANVDRSYIIQLLDNLIINSINYCKRGKINVTLRQNRSSLQIVISDTGIGIPKNELYEVFEPFTVGSRTKTPAGGRGLGLAICKRILEVHGGTIKVESNGAQGATFRVELPI